MSVVIKVENLSKYYRLGLIGGGTLREDVNRWVAKMRGKQDPMLKIGEQDHGNRKDGQIWALRDVNLEVKEGEILGIIGQNGAGKSTLLKIISRITAPTEGRIKIKGRVGSLLEVGTGFHPELTGRENIYLNGAILGMSRAEITSKLDEIVEFAEMTEFIDTPVKRYSSGMTVRLAFAVAAHLEPEILVIDEVLAVGDAAFQKKCLGKIQGVSKQGRTVLFVSHNMQAMQMVCPKAVLLNKGAVQAVGEVAPIIHKYLAQSVNAYGITKFSTEVLELKVAKAKYQMLDDFKLEITIDAKLLCHSDVDDLLIDFEIDNEQGVRIVQNMAEVRGDTPLPVMKNDEISLKINLETAMLAPGNYSGAIYAYSRKYGTILYKTDIPLFHLAYDESGATRESAYSSFKAVLVPKCHVEMSIGDLNMV